MLARTENIIRYEMRFGFLACMFVERVGFHLFADNQAVIEREESIDKGHPLSNRKSD